MLRLLEISLLVDIDQEALDYYKENLGDLVEAIVTHEDSVIRILEINNTPADFNHNPLSTDEPDDIPF